MQDSVSRADAKNALLRVEKLEEQVKSLRKAYDALFDFLAGELGFTAKETSRWCTGLTTPWICKTSPRELGMTDCTPTVKRTKKPRARK